MPTYEFRCKKCDHKFEVFTTISERERVKCPKCESSSLIQIFGSFYTKGKSTSSCNTCKASTCSSCSLARKL